VSENDARCDRIEAAQQHKEASRMMAHWQAVAVKPSWHSCWAERRANRPGAPLDGNRWATTGFRLLTAAVLLLMAACATQAKYRTYVDGFIGKNADQLYATWGAPLRSAPTPDGGQVVSFLTNVQSGRGFGVAGCETSFILDRGGMVRQASFRGEACYTE
jgi:hypothetical protein